MKVLVCGSRSWTDTSRIKAYIDALPDGTIVIEGGADGADANARHFAHQRGLFVATMPVKQPHWQRFGGGAGHRRNYSMFELGPDRVGAFQRDGSSGTQGAIDEAHRRGVPVDHQTA